MADQDPNAAPAAAESAAPEAVGPQSFEQSFESAEQSLESGAEGAAPATPAPDPGKADQLPEHLAWAKSVSGLVDPTTGELSQDRLAKQAFELNRQAQTQARTLTQFEAFLKIPKIAAAFNEVVGSAPPAAATAGSGAEDAPQTDEQILETFVNERINKALNPVAQQLQTVYQQYENSQMELAYKDLQNEFGKTEDGQHYVYDTVRDQVRAMIEDTARQAGVPVQRLLSVLIANNALTKTFSSAARNILFPTVRQKVEETRKLAQKVTDQKRTRLTAAGSPSRDVGQVQKTAMSFEEAAKAAEEALSA